MRDWSIEGKAERDKCYEPIKEEIFKYFPYPINDKKEKIKILFPG